MANYSENDFNIKMLGSFYKKDKTTFRVFAPESKAVYLVINNKDYQMHNKGFYFEIALGGDLENIKYYYRNDYGVSYKDPFAYFSDENYSYVLDKEKFISDVVVPKTHEDKIIYETSVRDFSCDSCFESKYKRKFLALTQEGLKLNDYYVIGLDYLKNIGITHLQLLPVFDFDLDNSNYNWGYNPVAYNYVSKDYVNDSNNPYAYVNELRSVVNILHENNICVTLDVVFNHVYNHFNFDLEKMIPGHVFRRKADGTLAKGTFCGNEIKSEDPFVRQYICEMCERYIELFDVDGLRFDLMGILDIDTIKLVEKKCKDIKHNFFIYGEGWNMGDALQEDKRATLINSKELPTISFFNDEFRDTIINYVSGNDSIIDDVKRVLNGNGKDLLYSQSINYVECHDNYTFFDHMIRYKAEDPIWVNVRRCKLALGLVMIARGIPFIHAGQEFLRTKNLVENSYNAGENINRIDWKRRVENNEICDYLKKLIKIRRENSEFIDADTNVNFENFYECLIYRLNDLMIIINPCKWDYTYKDEGEYHVLYDLNNEEEYDSDEIIIPAYSINISKRIH